MTTYEEVREDDTVALAFIAGRPDALNFYNLPVKAWAAKEDGAIVAVLMLRKPVHLDFIVANSESRPFMRILKLWKMAEAWLQSIGAPIVFTEINNSSQHFQSLVRRHGFVAVGANENAAGDETETIFAKQLGLNVILHNRTVH